MVAAAHHLAASSRTRQVRSSTGTRGAPVTSALLPVASSSTDQIARSCTGVEGLDDILGGGLPSNHSYLLDGEPGTGKTTLALQFLLNGVARGEPGLYVTLSESRAELVGVGKSRAGTSRRSRCSSSIR